MKTKRGSKTLSLLLAVCMVLTLLPMTAFAYDSGTINITEQPTPSLSTTFGESPGSISVAANTSNDAPISYDWHYETTGSTVNGMGDESTYLIPEDLFPGEEYKFYCVLTAEGCAPVTSDSTVVTVSKASYAGSTAGTVFVKADQATTGHVYTLPVLPASSMTYTLDSSGSSLIAGTPVAEKETVSPWGWKLTFNTSAQHDGTEEDIKLKINGEYFYQDSTFTLTVKAVGKQPVSITGLTGTDNAYSATPQIGYTGTPNTGGYAGPLEALYEGRNGTAYGSSATPPTDAGEYTVTLSIPGDADYTGSLAIDFSIPKREITVWPTHWITSQGEPLPDPDLGINYSGFNFTQGHNGDNSISKWAVVKLNVADSNTPGESEITFVTYAELTPERAKNYTLKHENGTLTIQAGTPGPVADAIFVGGVKVTPENKGHITGGDIKSGSASYDPASKTLTLTNAVIAPDDYREFAIESYADITVKLVGNNVLGVNPDVFGSYKIRIGIYAPGKDVRLIGGGNLTIYDISSGVEGKNVTVEITGTLTVRERGTGMACALKADGGALTIQSGTLDLLSHFSNALYGDSILINGGTITAQTLDKDEAAFFAFNNEPTIAAGYGHKVWAGNSAASAVEVASPVAATFTQSKYVKIGLVAPTPDPGPGSGGGGGSYMPSTPTTPGKGPDQSITAAAPVTATAGAGGTASASIPEKSITDAIAKAQADAMTQGSTANGIAVGLNVTMPQGATSLTATLTQSSLDSLVSAGVTSLELNGAPVALGFDLNALKEIQQQSGGDISISIAPAAGLSAQAQALIGNRPVYNITVSYVRDGKTVDVTSLGSGTATLSIPYTPGSNEAVGHLFGVYVDAAGNPLPIDGSAYDANAGGILIPSNHFSVYGIGYTAPSAKFTDIGTHWAKESIDYAAGRGILSGVSETAFGPDTAMTRGMLVTALGRLANVDAKTYTANSFTDVKADSAFGPYIEWARSQDIVQGIGNGQFAPGRAVTREEIAVIFANYAKATGYTLPVTREATTYADTDRIGSTYQAAVTAMQQAGIMMGGTGNKFNAKASATRGEVSSMLHRYIRLTIDPATAQGWALNDAGQYLYYKDGKAVVGTQTIDGKSYYFNADGSLAANTKIDEYEVDENGVRI